MKDIKQELFTMSDTGLMLGLSTVTIEKRCEEGELIRLNLNPQGKYGTWRIPLSSIQEFLNKCTH